MLDTSNLSKFIKGITDTIRAKKGTTEPIEHKLIDEEIANIKCEQLTTHMNSFYKAFYNNSDPSLTEIILEYGKEFRGDCSSFLTYSHNYRSSIQYVKFVGDVVNNVDITDAFRQASVRIVDFSECGFVFKTMNRAFFSNNNLITIKGKLDCNNVTSFDGTFNQCRNLADVEFVKERINYSIGFPDSDKLTDETIQSIIEGLAYVTTAQTLTLHADVKARLTEEQIAIINEKGWTLA